MTHREAFEKAKAHLLMQNAKSVTQPGHITCAYRSPDGKQCAIGCLIPDAEYRSGFENKSISFLLRDNPAALPSLKGLDLGFLHHLQQVHDDYEPEFWAEKLISFEEYWNRLLTA